MTVFDNIKKISAQRGFTIKSVATKAGIGENSIYRWKKIAPSTASLSKVATVLNVSINDLLDDSTDESETFKLIQRKAKNLSDDNQKKLLAMMDAVFNDKEE